VAAGGLLVSAIYFNNYLLSSRDNTSAENKNLDFDWKIRRLSSSFLAGSILDQIIRETTQRRFVWLRGLDATSDPLYNHRDALTAADAGCCETVALAPATQLVENRKHQSRARCAQWMAESYRPSVYVGARAIQT
jgi:hypothetical protein